MEFVVIGDKSRKINMHVDDNYVDNAMSSLKIVFVHVHIHVIIMHFDLATVRIVTIIMHAYASNAT